MKRQTKSFLAAVLILFSVFNITTKVFAEDDESSTPTHESSEMNSEVPVESEEVKSETTPSAEKPSEEVIFDENADD